MHRQVQGTGDPEDDWLQHAAEEASRPVVERLVAEVVDGLRSQGTSGNFEDIAARHLWDEYCWQLQEGPFDVDFLGHGSLSDGFASVVDSQVRRCLDELPRHLLQFLTIYAGRRVDIDETEPGMVNLDAIVQVIKQEVDRKAAERDLDLLGPYRADTISDYVSMTSSVARALTNEGRMSDLLSEYADEVVRGSRDLRHSIGEPMLNEYWGLLLEAAEESDLLTAFLGRYEKDLRVLILDREILPDLEAAAEQISEALDG